MFATLADVDAILAARPTDSSMFPLPASPARPRIVPAHSVVVGDVIVGGVDEREAGWDVDWFCEVYEAHPSVFDPTCQCGVCDDVDPSEGEMVVLTSEFHHGPWLACDPWPADRLVLVLRVGD